MNEAVPWDVDRPDLTWTIDLMHNPKPYPPLMHDARTFIAEGTSRALRRMGVPSVVRYQNVNGYTYGVHEHVPDPPAPERTVEDRAPTLWRDWEAEYLPEIRQIYENWDAVAVLDADRAGLRTHLDWVLAQSVRLWEIHFFVVEPAFHSLEAFFDFCRQQVPGSSDLDAAVLLQGYPNVLTAFDDALWDLAAREAGVPEHQRVVAEFLLAYGALGDEQGEFFSRSWADDPAMLFRELELRAALPDPRPRRREQAAVRDAALASVRGTLTPEARMQFDTLHALARDATVLSEDHHFYIDRQWSWRLKRLIAAIGTWLVRRGQLVDPGDVPFLTLVELRNGIREPLDLSGLGPERRNRFAQQRRLVPPRTLGARAGQPEGRFWGTPVLQDAPDQLRGLAASPGIARGRAVVLRSQRDTERVRPGDVLVCGTTNASTVPFFDIIGALVTDTGGVLSHAAVVAREFGLPAVVGTQTATRRIHDGQIVEVDGTRGMVTLS